MRVKRIYRSFWFSMLALSVLTLAVLLAPIQSASAAKVKVGTALRTHPVFAMPMLAIEDNGLWKRVGVDAEWIPFKGGSAMQRAVAGKSIQVAVTAVTGTVVSVSRGLPVTIVYHMGPVTDFGIWVLNNSPIKKPADLKGKTVATTRLGGTGDALGQLAAKAEGLEGSMKIVGAGGGAAATASLLSGAVEGRLTTYFNILPLESKGRVRRIIAVPDYLPKPWMGRVVYSTNSFIKEDPDTVAKVLRAINTATKFIMENKAWTVKTLKSHSRYNPEAAEMGYPRLKYSADGRIDKAALANVRDFLIKFKLVKEAKTPPVEKMYTDRFTR